ncbi:hypothetical protein ONZ45_g10532 [Pleurotus djamor]|nr:hypothetical protein ONZ45_g10532 [Pleurotus djamor]
MEEQAADDLTESEDDSDESGQGRDIVDFDSEVELDTDDDAEHDSEWERDIDDEEFTAKLTRWLEENGDDANDGEWLSSAARKAKRRKKNNIGARPKTYVKLCDRASQSERSQSRHRAEIKSRRFLEEFGFTCEPAPKSHPSIPIVTQQSQPMQPHECDPVPEAAPIPTEPECAGEAEGVDESVATVHEGEEDVMMGTEEQARGADQLDDAPAEVGDPSEDDFEDEEMEECIWQGPVHPGFLPRDWKELREQIKIDLKKKNLPRSQYNQLLLLRCFANTLLKGLGWLAASKQVAFAWHEKEGHWFARRLRALARHYQQYERLPDEKRGGARKGRTLLLHGGVEMAARAWLNAQKVGSITPRLFQDALNKEILPALDVSLKKPLCERTARRWLGKLGWRRTLVRKGVYMDGHERADVREHRDNDFLPTMLAFESRMTKYQLKDGKLEPNPPTLGPGEKEIIAIFQDESTMHGHEYQPSLWLREGENVLRKKGRGRLIHISDFVTEVSGRLVIRNADGEIVEDARTIIYPGTNGDAWWDHEQLLSQVERAIAIFNKAHPGKQALFIFDQSSAHATLGPDALRAFDMNKSNGGKQRRQKDTIIPQNNPAPEFRGRPQRMTLDNGEAKGLQQVLEERGFDVKGLRAKCKRVCAFESQGCCMARLLSQQDDFKNQISLLETKIRAAGHECLFLPKFHCELNPIEMVGGRELI